MKEELIQYVNLLFAGAHDCEDIRQEILQNTLDRYNDLIVQGKVPEAAYRLAISSIGDIHEILGAPTTSPTVDAAPSRKNRKRLLSVLMAILIGILAVLSATLIKNYVGQTIYAIVEPMKEQIDAEDIRIFKRDQNIFIILLLGLVILPMPLVKYLNLWGILLWLIWAVVCIFWSVRMETQKMQHNVHTYKEIIAFLNGKRLDELEMQQEIGKRPYQHFLIVLAVALAGMVMVLLLRRWMFGF